MKVFLIYLNQNNWDVNTKMCLPKLFHSIKGILEFKHNLEDLSFQYL